MPTAAPPGSTCVSGPGHSHGVVATTSVVVKPCGLAGVVATVGQL